MHIEANASTLAHTIILTATSLESGHRSSAVMAPTLSDDIDGFTINWSFGLPQSIALVLKSEPDKTFPVTAVRCNNANLLLDCPDGLTGLYIQNDLRLYNAHESPKAWDRHAKRGLGPVETAKHMLTNAPDDFHSMDEWLSDKPDVLVVIPNIGGKSELQPYSAQELFNALKENNNG